MFENIHSEEKYKISKYQESKGTFILWNYNPEIHTSFLWTLHNNMDTHML